MCGIAGFISDTASADTRRETVERMTAAMLHRGPDDVGLVSSEIATLGMRRLAIFDPAHGHQPMATADGRFHFIFNGAIYNFRELRAELAAAGHTFRTDCDTEVLLAAYAHWGRASLSRLRGMFAFAVWDTHEQTLFLARDPFGIKPLYYAERAGELLFASELNALLASGQFSAAVDPVALSAGLAYLAVPAPRTIYSGLRSLRPGECALFHAGRLAVQTYWNFNDAGKGESPCATRAEFITQLRAKLEDATRAHSLADVPVGAFLSGGLDSSAIVGLMSRQSGARLKTFSIGFAETEFSEAAEAEQTARHFGTEHHTFTLSGEHVAADIEHIVAALDQPTGDGINTYYVSQAARAGGVTVALSGLGGDELFGGYPWFHTTPRLAGWLPAWRVVPVPLRELALRRLRRGDSRQQKLADFLTHAHNLHEIAGLQRRNFSETARRAVLATGIGFTPHDEIARLPLELARANPFEVVSAWELRTYMADVLLRDSDVMSMRHSLELRVPFIDRPLINWLWRQPTTFKADGATPKTALADAVRDLLPPALAGRKKRGFTLPFAVWMRGPLRPFLDHTFSDASVSRSGLFDPEGVRTRWRRFIATNDPREWSRVWNLAIVIAFVNRTARATA